MDPRTAPAFTLRSNDDDTTPVLTAVQAEGRLDGVLFTMTLRQTFRNAGPRNVEAIYTFPLPAQAVLLGLSAEFDGHRVDGRVMPRAQAERVYEEALADGDAPVLLEVAASGLHTANVGNLKPGETVVLEVRFAQLLAFEQGRLRLVVPTTIAPRYGAAERGGLQPHQVPPASLAVEYPLTVGITVTGSLAGGKIECPTHPHRLERSGGAARFALAEGARLDRDVVLVVTPAEPRPDLLVTSRGEDGSVVALAAFEVPPAPMRTRIALGVLVDGSGSMNGDSIASARRAVGGLLDGLGPRDRLSLSCFGSRVRHDLPPSPCASAVLAEARRCIAATDADMGGTEMAAALQAVFDRWRGEGAVDVLLITDGEIWDTDALVETARAGGHRVFAIGVGSAPAEGVLRRLAEATGGACEFATPGEALEAAAARMLRRIRQAPRAGLRVDWGAAPAWEVPLPAGVFGGDTVVAWAGFERGPGERGCARLVADQGDDGEDGTAGGDPTQRGSGALAPEVELARTCATAPAEGTDLARIAASRRLPLVDEAQALQLALDHQLVTDQTHCVLVHRRADEDKPTEDAELHRVQSMLAAGWGGTGSVQESMCFSMSFDMPDPAFDTPSVWRSGRTAAANVDALSSAAMDDIEIPAFLRKASAEASAGSPAWPTLRALARRVADHLVGGGDLRTLASLCRQGGTAPELEAMLEELIAQSIDEAQAWLLLAAWVCRRPGRDGAPSLHASLATRVDTIDEGTRVKAWEVMQRHLGGLSSDAWASSRARRLQRAMLP